MTNWLKKWITKLQWGKPAMVGYQDHPMSECYERRVDHEGLERNSWGFPYGALTRKD